jgi:hypothetical protein
MENPVESLLEIYKVQLDYIEMNVQLVMVHDVELVVDNLMLMMVVVMAMKVEVEECHLFLLILLLF